MKPISVQINVPTGHIEWNTTKDHTDERSFSQVLPKPDEFQELPKPKRESMTHESLKIQQDQELKTYTEPQYERKTVIKYHIGKLPLFNTQMQLVQSYSADVLASAGFARVSQSRYPSNFREELAKQNPKLGKAYWYTNKGGLKDICLITK